MQNARVVRPHLIEWTNKNKQTNVEAQIVTSHSSYLICWLVITVHSNHAVLMHSKYTANESISVINVADILIVCCILYIEICKIIIAKIL